MHATCQQQPSLLAVVAWGVVDATRFMPVYVWHDKHMCNTGRPECALFVATTAFYPTCPIKKWLSIIHFISKNIVNIGL